MGVGAREADTMHKLSNFASQQPNEIRERRQASEETLSLLRGEIGKPGTYDLPSAGPTPPPSAPVDSGLLGRHGYNFKSQASLKKYEKLLAKGYSDEEIQRRHPELVTDKQGGIFTTAKTKGLVTKATDSDGAITGNQYTTKLDPEAAVGAIKQTSAFRQVSRMMAESEQMLARSGPLWDEMVKNQQLPIIEGAATAARENAEAIRRAMARGGSARRDAFEAVTKMRQQTEINMQKGQALAEARTKLDLYARENAKSVIKFSDDWSANQAGIRESFNAAMDNASALMSSSAIPFMFEATNKAAEYRAMHHAAQRQKVTRWITGTIGLIGMVYGVQGSSGMFQSSLAGQASPSSSGGDGGKSWSDAGRSMIKQLGFGEPSKVNTNSNNNMYDASSEY